MCKNFKDTKEKRKKNLNTLTIYSALYVTKILFVGQSCHSPMIKIPSEYIQELGRL